MTATDVLKQSLAFYGRIFNKIFCVSFVASLIPLLLMGTNNSDHSGGLELLVLMVFNMFFRFI